MSRFSWDPLKDIANQQRHGLRFSEVISVFDDPEAIDDYDAAHSHPSEDRWTTIGWCNGRCIVVRVTWTDRDPDVIRIISARFADVSETTLYRQRVKP